MDSPDFNQYDKDKFFSYKISFYYDKKLIQSAMKNELGVELKNYLLDKYFIYDNFNYRLRYEITLIRNALESTKNDGEILRKSYDWIMRENDDITDIEYAFFNSSADLFLDLCRIKKWSVRHERGWEKDGLDRLDNFLNGKLVNLTSPNSKTVKKSFRGAADSILEPLYKKIADKVKLTEDEQKTYDKYLKIKQGLLRLGAKPKTHLGMLVYKENAKYLEGGARKTRRRRL